jgi:hypothetical protein
VAFITERNFWTGLILMGLQQKPMNVVFDTGSDWLVVQGTNCTNCQGDLFNATSSGVLANETMQVRKYGSAELDGYVYNDTVCLAKDLSSCVLKFPYLSVTK